jgi:putative ABC transport system ATP-binding protein
LPKTPASTSVYPQKGRAKGVLATAEELMRLPRIFAVPANWTWLARFSFPRRLVPRAGADAFAPSIYSFILQQSRREQIYLVIVTLLSLPFFYVSLQIPKYIVNAITGKTSSEELFNLVIPQEPYLLLLCGAYLAFILINGWFKLHINVKKGQVGERTLRRLRYELYQRLLRFPLHHFDRTAPGAVIAMMTGELEPVGGFIGEAFALPISQSGTLLTIFVFMFVQDPVLGAAAVAFFPLQGYLIPKMQRIIRRLGRERVQKIRRLSDRIGETIAARREIRANNGAPYQLADVAFRLGEIYDIRFEIFNRKFFVKFLNSFIGNLTPFFFYAIGGYLVIKEQLSWGALYAVIAAYKELASPWKELLDFYQNQQDVAIKYEQVVEQFNVPEMLDKRMLLEDPEEVEDFVGEVAAANVGLVDADGIQLLEGINFTFPLGADVAVVGHSNSGRNLLPQLLARLIVPTSGRLTIGDADLNTLPLAVSGRRIGFVGPTTFLFSASVRDNLLLGLRHRPGRPPDREPAAAAARKRAIEEARLSGNCEFDIAADWIDYQQAGAADRAALDTRIIEVLRIVDLEEDVYLFGLRGRLDPVLEPEAAMRIVEARRVLADRLVGAGLAQLVEGFARDRYNANVPVSENLLFGTPIGAVFEGEEIARNPYVQGLLDRLGLTGQLVEVGAQLARIMVELLAGLRPEHEFFEELGLLGAEDLPVLERILTRMEKAGIQGLSAGERTRLVALAFKLVAARDPLGLVDQGLRQRILQARQAFSENLPEALRGSVEFFDPGRYNAAASLQENLLFGSVLRDEADARERVHAVITRVLDELGLRRTIVELGLQYPVGTGGSRLSEAQRQKMAIAAAILKRPDLVALSDATGVLDSETEAAILGRLQQELAGRSLVCSLHRAPLVSAFDRVLIVDQGRLVDQVPLADLQKPGSALSPLMAAG